MSRSLTGLGYYPAAEDWWHRLGLTPLTGAPVTEALIEQRWAVASLLLSVVCDGAWPQNERAQAEEARARLEEARTTCLTLLDGTRRERGKDPKEGPPRWMELGLELLEVVASSAPSLDEVVATQLSDVLGNASEYPERLLQPTMARGFAIRLAADGVATLNAMVKKGVVCWAPKDPSAIGRLLNAYVQHAASALVPCTLRLIVALDTLPGSATASDFTDLWAHTLLLDKWKAVVHKVEFTSQALELVLSGPVAPNTVPKTIMIATISASAAYVPPSVRSVGLPLFDVERGKCLRVDCLTTDLMNVRRSLAKVLAGSPVRWADPTRSPGSTSTTPRTVLCGHFAARAVTTLELRMLVACLRNLHVPVTRLLAAEDIYADNAAMLLDVSDPMAALKVLALCDEMAFVTAKLVTVRSIAAPTAWEDRVEEIFSEDPGCCVSRLRWRRSRNGGRTIVQPAATSKQIQAAIRVERTCPAMQAVPFQAEITLHGHVGHGVSQIHGQIMAVLGAQGLSLMQIGAAETLQPDTWQAIGADMAAGPSGRMRLCLSSAAEVAAVRGILHDKAFTMGPDTITMAVHDDDTLAMQAKNGRGGARQKVAPPGAPPGL